MVRVRCGGQAGARALMAMVAAALASSCGPAGGATARAGDDAAAASPARYDWLQFDGDPAHSGSNGAEATISPQNVASLAPVFQVTLPAAADGAPVVLTGVSTAGGVRDLVFVATTAGHLVALDAATGATVWSVLNGPGTCRVNRGSAPCYTTSSPAIDPDRQYVYAYGLEGRVHKYAVGTGAEVTTGGWPELVTSKPWDEKLSPALVFATDATGTTYLYAANGGYPGDAGDYQGHVTAIDLATGAQQVFNTLCSDQTVHFVASPGTPDCPTTQSAVWARATMVYDAGTDRIFGATGNALYDPTRRYWGDSVFALHPDGTGSGGNPVDSYTPTNQASLDSADLDLGSTAPAILPGSGTRYPHLAAQSGKDSQIRLLDLSNLSGQGGPGHLGGELATVAVPQGGEVLTQPAVWVNPADGKTWLFVANGNGISGLTLSVDASGAPSLVKRWMKSGGGSSPLVANGVLYYAGSSHLRALDPTTGTLLFDGTSIGAIHWQSPVVANGVVYLEDQSGRLSAFGVTPATPDFAIAAAPSSLSVAQGASGTSTVTITPTGGFTGSVALSASGLPAGVTATFSPASTTGTSTLTLAASSTATAGAATVTITGSSGSLTHAATVNLTVTTPQAGDFTVAAAPSALTISQGAAQLSTLAIGRAGGFTGSVAFSVSGLPAGVSAVFDQTSTAGTSDFVTFYASSTAAAGTSTATITGTSGSLVHSATVALTIAPAGSRVLEAEAMTLRAAVVESNTSASGGNLVRIPFGNTGATSTATASYPGPSGVQTMTVFYYDENYGSARWQVSVAGRVVASWTADQNLSTAAAYSANAWNRTSRIIPGVTVNAGDAIVVTCTADLKDWCNLDDVTFATSSASPDFALSASPASLAVAQGASATTAITVSPSGGFGGIVALSASGLPAGVTATFSPASTTGASTLTLAASPTATTGPATITVTGASGTLVRSTSLSLTVSAPVAADFALSASPASLSLTQGGTATTAVSVAPSGGFAGSVALSASGLPAGVTAAFSPATTTGTSTLTLSATSAAATGSATVTVTGTSGSLTRTTTVALTVSAPPTTDFSLSAAPAALTISQGAGQVSTLSLARAGGFAGSVALGVSGLPAGVTAVLDQASTTGTSDFVTFYASATAAPGTSTVTVTGTSGSLVHSATVALTIAPAGTVLKEAEAMTLSGAVVEYNTSASGNDLVRIPFGNYGATSTATTAFSGAAATRTLTVFYYDENYGSARWQVSIAGRVVASWTADQNLSTAAAYSANARSRTSRIVPGVALAPGDAIVVQCTADLKDWCNLDDLTVQ